MWACQLAGLPAIQWSSSKDLTGDYPGIDCRRLESPLPGGTLSQELGWYKIARLIEGFPL